LEGYRPEVATVPALSKLKLTFISPGGKREPRVECTRLTGVKENVIALTSCQLVLRRDRRRWRTDIADCRLAIRIKELATTCRIRWIQNWEKKL